MARACATLAAILACTLLLSTGTVAGAAPGLPAAKNLAADGAVARTRSVPILLFFNRFDCPYCERALREFLVPMERDPAFAARVIFRQIEIDKPLGTVDFDGRATTHRDLAARFDIRFTPTIWLVDAEGKALAEPIVGLRTVDFYAWYLEQAIAESQAKLDLLGVRK
ncbi:MAG: thioredoxin fold domain-containing protein [Betaproteobacteria bacterium]